MDLFKPSKKIYNDLIIFIFFIIFSLIFAFTTNMGGDYGLYEKNYYANGELEIYHLIKNKELIYNLVSRLFYELSFNNNFFSIFLKILMIL